MSGEALHRIRCQNPAGLPLLAGDLLEQGGGDDLDIVKTLPQGRNVNGQHGDAIIKVRSKALVGQALGQILRGGGNDAHIHLFDRIGAQRFNFPFLQRPQQLGLKGGGHVADLVEKQRAAMGQFELALARLAIGSGECPGRHAEELGFQQGLGNSRHIDRHEWTLGPVGLLMHGMRQQFLAGTCFPFDQHGTIAQRKAAHHRLELAHRAAITDKTRQRVLGLSLACQRCLGAAELPLQRGKLVEDRRQIIDIVVKHEADSAFNIALLILERDAAHHELAIVEIHDVEQDRTARLHHSSQQRMGDDLLDTEADRVKFRIQFQKLAIAFVDPGDARIEIDRDGTGEIFPQQAEGTHRVLDIDLARHMLIVFLGLAGHIPILLRQA